MKEQEKNNDLITRFFDLALSEEELLLFEEKVANDPEFRKKVEIYEQANAIVNKTYPIDGEAARTQKWKKLLNDKEITLETAKSSKTISWKWIGSIAAGFVLLFSIWQFGSTFQQPNMDDLLAASWDKNVGLGYYTSRSTGKDPLQEKLAEAFIAYKNSNYNEAVKLTQEFEKSETYYNDALLIKALSTHKLGNSKKSLALLTTLTKAQNSKVAKWYMGLIYLDLGDRKAAENYVILPKDSDSKITLKEE